MTPPARGARSRTTKSTPRVWSSYAADRPAMPPPMITASCCGIRHQARGTWHVAPGTSESRVRPDEILEHRDERRRGVQRLGPPQRDAGVAGRRCGLTIDVEQNLRMVAHEADRYGEDPSHAGGRPCP